MVFLTDGTLFITAVDAILHLRRESFDSTGVQWPDSLRYPSSGIGEDGKLARVSDSSFEIPILE